METSAGSRRLIHEWDTSGGMEAYECCCEGDGGEGEGLGGGEGGGEAGLLRQNTLTHLPRQKQTRRRRMAKLFPVALVLLLVAALALVLTAVQGWRGQQAADGQLTTQPSSGYNYAQQQHAGLTNPSAMLTAPAGNNTVSDGNWTYLEWESRMGKAFCRGGFNYSRGGLVVPRTGIYRVFVQITFESKEGHHCENAMKLYYTVYLWAENYKENVDLLSAVDTVTCRRRKTWTKSLYTSGLFNLEANSKLRVSSPCPNYIVAGNEQEVFFGAELLP